MNESLERALIEALDLIEQGWSVEQTAARFPEHAAELRPFLQTAVALATLPAQPSATAEQASKRDFLAAAAAPSRPGRSVGLPLARLLAPLMAALAVILLAGAALVGAAGSAAPGDALYETKRFVEEARLNLTADPERAAALREQFRRERLREIGLLLAAGRTADVSLTGTIEMLESERWLVDGVPVEISPATLIDGRPVVGALVEIEGRTVFERTPSGAVLAERVVVLKGMVPDIEPTPTPGISRPVAPGGQPPVTPKVPFSPSATPEPSPTVTAAPTLAQPTAAPATNIPPPPPPPPPPTPDDDDDGNDNGGDDNANDNDDDDDGDDNGGDDNATGNPDNNADDNDGDDDGDDNADDNGGNDDDNDNRGNDADDDDDNGGDDGGGGDNDDDDNGDDGGDD